MVHLARFRHLLDDVGLPAVPVVVGGERVGVDRSRHHRLRLRSLLQQLPEDVADDEGEEAVRAEVVEQPLRALPALVDARPAERVEAEADPRDDHDQRQRRDRDVEQLARHRVLAGLRQLVREAEVVSGAGDELIPVAAIEPHLSRIDHRRLDDMHHDAGHEHDAEREMHEQPGDAEHGHRAGDDAGRVERRAGDPEREQDADQADVPESRADLVALERREVRRRHRARRAAPRQAEGAADEDQAGHDHDQRQQQQAERPRQLLRQVVGAEEVLRVVVRIHRRISISLEIVRPRADVCQYAARDIRRARSTAETAEAHGIGLPPANVVTRRSVVNGTKGMGARCHTSAGSPP